MSRRTKKKIEFGDFQTPLELARQVCTVLHNLGISPRAIVEPTCGKGSFLQASAAAFPKCMQMHGFDINPDYVAEARTLVRADVQCADFFQKDWPLILDDLPEPILVIGNPPWVTNSAVGMLRGTNLPAKSNFLRFQGFDAMTGKSNFDISEWMLLHLMECLSGRQATLAMLCKSAVARKVLCHAWKHELPVVQSNFYRIDAGKHFDASVDAGLLICFFQPGCTSDECTIYSKLEASAQVQSSIAWYNGRLVADRKLFEISSHLVGVSPLKWRSGVKHDCARIMELRCIGGDTFRNGLGEVVDLETTHLYPMLKSSDLMKPHPIPSRYMLVTQRTTREDTAQIAQHAPRVWNYLLSHADRLDMRKSSIYQNRPRFSIFGVGPYSFAPWKVAVSGFTKHLQFHCVGPFQSKPVMLDDTCYFLPCHNEHDARLLTELLNSEPARNFFHGIIFWDAKRPLTVQVLSSLNLNLLAQEIGIELPARLDATPDLFSTRV